LSPVANKESSRKKIPPQSPMAPRQSRCWSRRSRCRSRRSQLCSRQQTLDPVDPRDHQKSSHGLLEVLTGHLAISSRGTNRVRSSGERPDGPFPQSRKGLPRRALRPHYHHAQCRTATYDKDNFRFEQITTGLDIQYTYLGVKVAKFTNSENNS
jgi:hypothetical protein